MRCVVCGKNIPATVRYCAYCGAQTQRAAPKGQLTWGMITFLVGAGLIGGWLFGGGLRPDPAPQVIERVVTQVVEMPVERVIEKVVEKPVERIVVITPSPIPQVQSSPEPTQTTAVAGRDSAPATTQVSNKDGMTLVYVPAGEFLMGSADSDRDADSDEKPQHRVVLNAYWIDQTEVTQDQYQRCVAAGNCRAPACSSAGRGDHPVVCVSWEDAANYCAWAGRRLPTEAEWEKAARGSSTDSGGAWLYPWGNLPPTCNRLNYWGKDRGCIGTTSAAGSYPSGASPYGVLDMAGNVWEWVADWYHEKYYSSSPAQNPVGPDSGTYRVLRGGSWNYLQRHVRTTYRLRLEPDDRGGDVGFRCALSP